MQIFPFAILARRLLTSAMMKFGRISSKSKVNLAKEKHNDRKDL